MWSPTTPNFKLMKFSLLAALLLNILLLLCGKRRIPGDGDDKNSEVVDFQRKLFQGVGQAPQPTSRNDHRVSRLPGLSDEDFKSISQYAGHLLVDPKNNGHHFYWLFEAPNNASSTAPLIIFLNGGPGCSSMDGLFLEVGPFRLNESGNKKIRMNGDSWHGLGNLLFVDQPVGTGLAYTASQNGYATSDDIVNNHFLAFLDSFLTLHSNFLSTRSSDGRRVSRPIYLTGESHAGHYIPSMVAAIIKRNSQANFEGIILDVGGIALGNPWIDPYRQYDASDIAHGFGLITQEQKFKLKEAEKTCQGHLQNGRYNTKACFALLDDIIDSSSIAGSRHVLMYDSRKYSHAANAFPPGHLAIEQYLNEVDVREAIHATSCPHKYVECANNPYNALKNQDGKGVTSELSFVLNRGIRVLVYAGLFPSCDDWNRLTLKLGQYDLVCNHLGVEKALLALNWTGAIDWIRSQPGVWVHDKSPAGYTKSAKNLQFLRFLDSGHMVPMDQPTIALDMISRFISNSPLSEGNSKIGLSMNNPFVECGVGSINAKSGKGGKGKRLRQAQNQ